MKVISKITDLKQECSKDDWAALEASGHAKNFVVTDPNDDIPFAPAELAKAKKSDAAKEA